MAQLIHQQTGVGGDKLDADSVMFLNLHEVIETGYENSLDLVNRETLLDPKQLPQSCPFSELELSEKRR